MTSRQSISRTPQPFAEHEEELGALRIFLKSYVHRQSLITHKKRCSICGHHNKQVYYDENRLPVCEGCKRSSVCTERQALGLLYLAYNSFKELFPVHFRYPNLEVRKERYPLYQKENREYPKQIRDQRERYSDLIQITEEELSDFSISVRLNVPSCFMDELYAYCFADEFINQTIAEVKENKKGVENAVQKIKKKKLFQSKLPDKEEHIRYEMREEKNAVKKPWDEGDIDSSLLAEKLQVAAKKSSDGLNKQREIWRYLIMMCYLDAVGRKEQKELLLKFAKIKEKSKCFK